jgi:hypothetical protein
VETCQGTHSFSRFDAEPVFPRRYFPPIAGELRSIAVLDVAQQGKRLVGFEGREVGADEDGLLLKGSAEPRIVC